MQAFVRDNRQWMKWLLLATACGGVLFNASAMVPPPPAPPAAGAEPTLSELAIQRYQLATKGYDLATIGHQPNEALAPDAMEWMRRRVKARLDLSEPKNDRVAFIKEYVVLLEKQEAFEDRMVSGRLHPRQSLLNAQYELIEGRMLLKQAEVR